MEFQEIRPKVKPESSSPSQLRKSFTAFLILLNSFLMALHQFPELK